MNAQSQAAISIVGLGPGSLNAMTLEAYQLFTQAAANEQPVYLRTTVHPTVAPLQQALPALRITSFDGLYEEADEWDSLYQRIATEICLLAEKSPVIYAVPGHPLVGDTSVQLIQKEAAARNLRTRIVGGLSFIEPACTLLDLDPVQQGMQIVDAIELAGLSEDEIAGKIIPTVPLLVAQLYNRRVASAVKLALSECYPDTWSVKLVQATGIAGEEHALLEMPLHELDRDISFTNHLSILYVPPVGVMAALRVPETLRYITMRLRREPDGCPWDREQTHESLKRYVLEEAYEVVEAIEEKDMDHLAEELGDLLLQVYLHSEVARQSGEFMLGDVYEQVNAKLIRRHPHVFGDAEANTAGQVVQNWDAIKKQERIDAGKDVQTESVLDRVPQVQPALAITQEYIKRAVKVGFEFTSADEAYAKLDEELNEVKAARTREELLEELGDLLFMVAKLARFFKIDAEEALRATNRKFKSRFQYMEKLARVEERPLSSYSRDEWDALWQRAKVESVLK